MNTMPSICLNKTIKVQVQRFNMFCIVGSRCGGKDKYQNTKGFKRLWCGNIPHVDTGNEVCNLAWSKNVNELVSTHGYSQNQIMVWKYRTLAKVVTLTGHSMRVLYLAMSPDG